MKKTEIGVATWNILYDDGFFGAESQTNRLQNFLDTLSGLPVNLDVVGLQEVEAESDTGHIGKRLAQSLTASDGYWVPHSRPGESIGLLGSLVESELCEVHDNEAGRKFIKLKAGGIDFNVVHLAFALNGDKLRQLQAGNIIDTIKLGSKAVVMGDFNSLSRQRSRRIIENAGFVSVFEAMGKPRPATVLTEKYRKYLPFKFRMATKYGLMPDDMYVRGVEVLDAGVFEGDSDHRGIWARLAV